MTEAAPRPEGCSTQVVLNSVVLGRWANKVALVRRSRARPDAIFISVAYHGIVARDGFIAEARPQAIKTFLYLCCAQGRAIPKSEMVELLFGDDPNGGPDSADVVIRGAVADAKLIGAALGIVIFAVGQRGYCARILERASV